MAKKKQARITLVGPLSYSVGRYRFQKGKALVTEDQELISYLTGDPNFKVETIEVEVAEAKAPAAPAKSESKPAPKPEPEPEAESDEDMEEVKAPAKSAPPSKLARKANSKKETANETD